MSAAVTPRKSQSRKSQQPTSDGKLRPCNSFAEERAVYGGPFNSFGEVKGANTRSNQMATIKFLAERNALEAIGVDSLSSSAGRYKLWPKGGDHATEGVYVTREQLVELAAYKKKADVLAVLALIDSADESLRERDIATIKSYAGAKECAAETRGAAAVAEPGAPASPKAATKAAARPGRSSPKPPDTAAAKASDNPTMRYLAGLQERGIYLGSIGASFAALFDLINAATQDKPIKESDIASSYLRTKAGRLAKNGLVNTERRANVGPVYWSAGIDVGGDGAPAAAKAAPKAAAKAGAAKGAESKAATKAAAKSGEHPALAEIAGRVRASIAEAPHRKPETELYRVVTDLAGPGNAQLRAEILSALTGERVPKARAGVTALHKAVAVYFKGKRAAQLIPTETILDRPKADAKITQPPATAPKRAKARR